MLPGLLTKVNANKVEVYNNLFSKQKALSE